MGAAYIRRGVPFTVSRGRKYAPRAFTAAPTGMEIRVYFCIPQDCKQNGGTVCSAAKKPKCLDNIRFALGVVAVDYINSVAGRDYVVL